MKILALSDILWAYRNPSIDTLVNIVKETKPSLILLAGDLVDIIKSTDWHPTWDKVRDFLEYLSSQGITTLSVRGNWDGVGYDRVFENPPRHIYEISGRVYECQGVRILGIPYDYTDDLSHAKRLAREYPEPVDIVIAHAELKRRLWLFHLQTRLLITGHYDTQLCQVRDTVFMALGCCPRQYAAIDLKPNNFLITYYDHGQRSKLIKRQAKFSRGRLTWQAHAFKAPRRYAKEVELFLDSREQLAEHPDKRSQVGARFLRANVARSHVREYLPGLSLGQIELELESKRNRQRDMELRATEYPYVPADAEESSPGVYCTPSGIKIYESLELLKKQYPDCRCRGQETSSWSELEKRFFEWPMPDTVAVIRYLSDGSPYYVLWFTRPQKA